MIYDCHLHTEFSGDSNTPINLQIERAIELGTEEMHTTDRYDYDSGFYDCDFILDIPTYLMSLRILQVKCRGRIRTNIGIELKPQNHLKEYLDHFVKRYRDSFDFIIGSDHFVKSIDPYDPEHWSERGEVPGFEDFFEASLVRVRDLCRTFSSFGHLDYAVRYAPHQSDFYDYRHLSQWIDPLLKIPIENGKSLKCNTGGFRYSLDQPSPCRKILMRYRELKDEMITIGSDVHAPEYVSYAFDTYHELLPDYGHRYLTVYHGRKSEFIPLQPEVSVCA